ncbi:MAG: MFS transporter [Trueperella sp.]|nr:MFS transporter [Trueperella sp.]
MEKKKPDELKPANLPREIWVLVAAAMAVALGFGIVAPVLPRFAKGFGVSTTAATVVVSAFAFMRLSFAPISGRLSSIFGERRMYLVGITIVSASSLASAFAENYWQLLIFRSVGGIGSVTFTVAAMSLIIRLAPPHARGRASAAYGAGFLIGNIAGPAVGALLAPLGYRWPFAIYAAFLMVAFVIVAWQIPATSHKKISLKELEEEQDAQKHVKAAPKPNPDPKVVSPMTVREALQIKLFRIVLLTAFAQGWTNLGVRVAVVPLLAASIVGGPEWLPGGALAAFAIGNGLALARAGAWSDRYGRRPIVITGLLVSAAFTIAMGMSTSATPMLVISLFAGMGSGLVQPSQQGAVADVIGKRQGSRVVSTFQQAADLGQIIGPIVAGILVDVSGFRLAYLISGIIMLVAASVWIFFAPRNSNGQPQATQG